MQNASSPDLGTCLTFRDSNKTSLFIIYFPRELKYSVLMKKHTLITSMLLFLSAALLTAGGTQELETETAAPAEPARAVVITDALGRTVELPALPERIVQTGSSAFMVNDALFLFPEAQERVAAMADGNQGRGKFLEIADPAFADKKILPRTINVEEIMACRPDLVIMKDFLHKKYDETFQRAGIPVVYLNLETPEAWQKDLETLGAVFGNPERARELQKQFADYQSRVTDPLADLPESSRKKILILYYSQKDGAGAFHVPPLTFIQTMMTEMAGGAPVWKDTEFGKRWTKVGFEQIAVWDPDQIFLISYRTPIPEVMGILSGSPQWTQLRALKTDQVHPFPMDFHSWDQPDPRWLLGLQWMASIIHPETFGDVDMNESARIFFEEFYNVNQALFEEKIQPEIEGLPD